MSDKTTETAANDMLLAKLADELAARHRAGEQPSLQEYIDRYPELASEIHELFPATVQIEQVKDDRQQGPEQTAAPPPYVLWQLGDFRIVREVGKGGMGIVYEAEQVSLGRRVALKVMPRSMLLDATAKRRFEREAKAAAKLHHTNIVPVFGFGEQDGMPYYVMQFIQGLGLDDVLHELNKLQIDNGKAGALASGEWRVSPNAGQVASRLEGSRDQPTRTMSAVSAVNVARSLVTGEFHSQPDPEDQAAAPLTFELAGEEEAEQGVSPRPVLFDSSALSSSSVLLPGGGRDGSKSKNKKRTYWQSVASIATQVASALEYAHRQGILHRDIKPSNLLLDTWGTVWVTDFGLAKADDQPNLTHTGDILGTLRYMPPEAFEGKTDARSDVYSLGLTLYELLAFRPAYDEQERNRLIRQVTNEEPERLDGVNRLVPRDLVTIVNKAIERDPAHRYPTAGELAADLQRFLDDEPILARRQSQRERFLRWARRNPGIAFLGAAFLTVLVLVTIGSLMAAGHFNYLRGREATAAAGERDARRDAEEAAAGERDARQLAEKAATGERAARQQAEQAATGERAARQLAEKAVTGERTARQQAEEAATLARRRGDAERWERYRSNIAAAAAALQQQNTSSARLALEAAPPEHRNWEWRHFHSQLDGARLVVSVPGWPASGHALCPSGTQFAVVAGQDSRVHLYDVATGKIAAAFGGPSSPGNALAYRPDGKELAALGRDGRIHLWDLSNRRESAVLSGDGRPLYSPDGTRIASPGGSKSQLWNSRTGKEIAVLAEWQPNEGGMAFSPDGKLIAVTSKDCIRLCDAGTGRLLATLGPRPDGPGDRLAFSADSKRLAGSMLHRPTVYLWDTATGKEVAALRGHTFYVRDIRFSPDGSRVVTASDYPENTARLWDAATGRPLKILAGHKNSLTHAVFSPDGRRIATSSMDQTARLWDGVSGEPIGMLGGHTGWVAHVLFSPDSARLLTASTDATLRLWDAQTGELIAVLRGHGGQVYYPPLFTPDGSQLVSSAEDGTVRIWDLRLVERNGVLRGHESFVYDVTFSPDGEHVASSAWDGTARLWDATSGRQTGLLKHEKTIVSSVSFSRDGRRLVTVERDRGITLWDVPPQKVARTWSTATGFWGADTRAALNPAGTLLACACKDGPVGLWDTAGGQELAQLKGHEGCSIDVAFSPDGRLLASTGYDRTVRLWDVTARKNIAVLRGHGDPVWRVAWSGDGKLLASGSGDSTIRFWDSRTGAALGVAPAGSKVYGLAFNPDNTRLAAGCADGRVRLFDVATRQLVAELRGHTDFVHAVAWSPDGTRLVSGSGDRTLRVWDSLPPAARARTLDAS